MKKSISKSRKCSLEPQIKPEEHLVSSYDNKMFYCPYMTGAGYCDFNIGLKGNIDKRIKCHCKDITKCERLIQHFINKRCCHYRITHDKRNIYKSTKH